MEQRSFWQKVLDNIWLLLILSNLIFFTVYILWGLLDISRIPVR